MSTLWFACISLSVMAEGLLRDFSWCSQVQDNLSASFHCKCCSKNTNRKPVSPRSHAASVQNTCLHWTSLIKVGGLFWNLVEIAVFFCLRLKQPPRSCCWYNKTTERDAGSVGFLHLLFFHVFSLFSFPPFHMSKKSRKTKKKQKQQSCEKNLE